MATAHVFRPVKGWKGTVGHYEDYPLGDVTDVIVGGAAPAPISRFPGVVSTEGMIGIPYEQDSNIIVQKGDVLDLGTAIYFVTGPRQWEEDHTFSGTDVTDDYYWVEVTASYGGSE